MKTPCVQRSTSDDRIEGVQLSVRRWGVQRSTFISTIGSRVEIIPFVNPCWSTGRPLKLKQGIELEIVQCFFMEDGAHCKMSMDDLRG